MLPDWSSTSEVATVGFGMTFASNRRNERVACVRHVDGECAGSIRAGGAAEYTQTNTSCVP